mgnify:CR=1 FL=1
MRSIFVLFFALLCVVVTPCQETHLARYQMLVQLLSRAETSLQSLRASLMHSKQLLQKSESERAAERRSLQTQINDLSQTLTISKQSLLQSESLLKTASENAKADEKKIKALETEKERLKSFVQILGILSLILGVCLALCVTRLVWMQGHFRMLGTYHPP